MNAFTLHSITPTSGIPSCRIDLHVNEIFMQGDPLQAVYTKLITYVMCTHEVLPIRKKVFTY